MSRFSCNVGAVWVDFLLGFAWTWLYLGYVVGIVVVQRHGLFLYFFWNVWVATFIVIGRIFLDLLGLAWPFRLLILTNIDV